MFNRLKAILVAALLGIGATAAHAQSTCPAIVQGAVLTAAQWNQCFSSKQDGLGYTPVNKAGDTMAGRLVATAPGVSAGLSITPGIAPSGPIDGDIWTTTTGVFARINGSTVGPFSAVGSTVPSVVQGDLLFGSAPSVISKLAKNASATRYLSNTGTTNNPAWAQVDLSTGVTGILPLASLPTGTQDRVLGYFASTTTSAVAVGNCATALTYNTSTHAFGCNGSTGSGTVTSVGLTNTYGLSLAGSPVTTSGSISAGVVLATVTNSLSGDVALSNVSNYFDGPSTSQGNSGTWFASGGVTLSDTTSGANVYCKLWDGTTVIDSKATTIGAINLFQQITLSGVLATPAANIRISCRDVTTTAGLIKFNATGNSKDSTLTVVRVQQ